ncbi:MAG: sugar-binding protein, partial [Gemmatimonadota bacterium]
QNVLPALRPVEGQLVGNNSWPADALDWKVRPFEGGYAVEASLPFERITGSATAQAGDLMRFDLMINDRDGADGGQSHHRLWSTGGASSNTSGFGLLTLAP